MSTRQIESRPGGADWASRPQLEGGSGPGGQPRRIALYSHDTQGLGHIRRNLLIARALCRDGSRPIILLCSGLREASAFAMPPGVDCLTLPSLAKGTNGEYFPRSLGISMTDLIRVRSDTIAAVLKSFEPDVLIVDKVPAGASGELLASLRLLRSRGATRVVLGLREILDDPDTVRREWAEGGYESAIREYYHRIWIYGDRAIYDTAREYGFPADIEAMVRYTGYLNPLDVDDDHPGHDAEPHLDLPPGPLVLCLVGGGRDGLPLAEAFLRASLPEGAHGVLVTGPLMPAEARATLEGLAAAHDRVRLLKFITDPCPLLRRADRVIAMGGYNTVCEILAFRKRALIVPRVEPRTEQLIRAERFAGLGLLDRLHPDRLSPAALGDWLADDSPSPAAARDRVDFDGVARLPQLLGEVLTLDEMQKGAAHAAS